MNGAICPLNGTLKLSSTIHFQRCSGYKVISEEVTPEIMLG